MKQLTIGQLAHDHIYNQFHVELGPLALQCEDLCKAHRPGLWIDWKDGKITTIFLFDSLLKTLLVGVSGTPMNPLHCIAAFELQERVNMSCNKVIQSNAKWIEGLPFHRSYNDLGIAIDILSSLKDYKI